MEYEDDPDTEVTLGTGKMLGLFLGLVIVCAVFFSLGYSLGRSSSARTGGSIVPDATAAPSADAEAAKPSPAVPAAVTNCPQGQDCTTAPTKADDLSFYKSVEQKGTDTKLPPAPAEKASAPAVTAPPRATARPALPGYAVQVAAVSKSQDADALVDALHQKQYPAFVTSDGGDKLFHVQVGPFTDIKDAEAMKARLSADGYNPILKR